MNTIKANDKVMVPVIGAVSVVVPALVAFLIFKSKPSGDTTGFVTFLPTLNAIINSTVSLLLILGLVWIKKGRMGLHKTAMMSAFFLSILFLVSYIIYHYTATHVTFGGEGAVKGIYLFILASHILLSVAIVPLAIFAIYRALAGQMQKHRKIVKFAWPIWFYVSVTGVVVYLMAHVFYA